MFDKHQPASGIVAVSSKRRRLIPRLIVISGFFPLVGCDLQRSWLSFWNSSEVVLHVVDSSGTAVLGAEVQTLDGQLLAKTEGPAGVARFERSGEASLVYVKPPADPLLTPGYQVLQGQFIDLSSIRESLTIRLAPVESPWPHREHVSDISVPGSRRNSEDLEIAAAGFEESELIDPSDIESVHRKEGAKPHFEGSQGQGVQHGVFEPHGDPASVPTDLEESAESASKEAAVFLVPNEADLLSDSSSLPSAAEANNNGSHTQGLGSKMADLSSVEKLADLDSSTAAEVSGISQSPVVSSEDQRTRIENDHEAISEPKLPQSLSKMEAWRLDRELLRTVHLAASTISADPDGMFRVFGVSSQKEIEVELGQVRSGLTLSVNVPTAFAFDSLRWEHSSCGAGIMPLLSSTPEQRQELRCATGTTENMHTIGVQYPAYGINRYFRGGQIRVGDNHVDLAAKLALFHVPRSALQIQPPKMPPAIRYESGQSLSHDLSAAEIDLSQSAHAPFVLVKAELPKPKVTFLTDEGRSLRLDQSLISRFNRSFRAQFLTSKNMIPVLLESLDRVAGYSFADNELNRKGWNGTVFDALLDFAILIRADESALTATWFDRFGHARSVIRLAYKKGEPPELFAKAAYDRIMAQFPEQLPAKLTQVGSKESLLKLEGGLQIGELEKNDVFEVFRLSRGGLIPLGRASLRLNVDQSLIQSDGSVELTMPHAAKMVEMNQSSPIFIERRSPSEGQPLTR